MSYLFWFNLLGTAVFAISGVLIAAQKKMDPIGALVLGVITAVGGGTIRDIILNNGAIFWISDSTDLCVAMVTAFITMLIMHFSTFNLSKGLFYLLDAVGLAVFVGIGINKAIACEVSGLVTVCMGVLTGVGGGIMRDILARDIPMVFRTDIYATACIIGGIVHVVAYRYLHVSIETATLIGISVTLIIRLIAIYQKLTLPIVKRKRQKAKQ